MSIILVSDQHMHISEASKAISVWEELRVLTPAQKEGQRLGSTSHTTAVPPTATRALNRRQQIKPRTMAG